eukprot:scaffold19186_cov117-Isochrysis_galbana.AAC.1
MGEGKESVRTAKGQRVSRRDAARELKKPRLPSALGLSGAYGEVAYTLASLSTLTPLSPLTPYRPPPSYSCTDGSYKPEGGGIGLCALPPLNKEKGLGGNGEGEGERPDNPAQFVLSRVAARE